VESESADEAEFADKWPSHDVIERELDRLTLAQAGAMSSLDTKAGLLAGFAAVLAGIAPSDTDALRLASRVVAVLAALAAVWAYWPKRQSEEISPANLHRAYLARPARETRETLLATRTHLFTKNEPRLQKKYVRMEIALILILVSVALLATDSILDTLNS
jgi:hypothetical protein